MKYVVFVIALVLFLAGLYVLSLSFVATEWQGAIAFGGLLLVCLAYGIPAHLLKRIAP